MIVLATPETAAYVAANLSDDEIAVKMYGRETAAKVAYACAQDSPLSWAVLSADDKPACLFGAYGSDDGRYGCAWMFSTPDIRRCKWRLLRDDGSGTGCAQAAIQQSRRLWPELRVDAEPRSPAQKRFLEFVGFRVLRRFERDGLVYEEMTL